jgi:hypothetical protein
MNVSINWIWQLLAHPPTLNALADCRRHQLIGRQIHEFRPAETRSRHQSAQPILELFFWQHRQRGAQALKRRKPLAAHEGMISHGI